VPRRFVRRYRAGRFGGSTFVIMMSEKKICQLLSSLLPRGRVNDCFESDSEIFLLNGAPYLFTTDEFCAEDLFRETEPFLLGWNIAAGAISDIHACGGKPLFYAHSLTVGETWNAEFLESFGRGVAMVLETTGTGFIGGDCGRSPLWRCTASVVGSCDGPPVLRRGARPGDLVYVTGLLGAGNLEAALRLYEGRLPQTEKFVVQFPLRQKESSLVRRFASACMDTSDGLWASLNTLAELNQCGYAVADVPRVTAATTFCSIAGIPPLLLLFGECGEYELLFTIHPERRSELETEAGAAGCSIYQLGEMTASSRSLQEGNRIINLNELKIEARDFDTPYSYLATLAKQLGLTLDWPRPTPDLIRKYV
jgi:thiamine-monophosphate kinase